MSKFVRNMIVLCGCAVIAVGAVAYYVGHAPMPPSAPPVAPTPAPLPASPQAAPDPVPAPTADVATMAFPDDKQTYSLVRDSAAYVAASLDAPSLYPLTAGTGVASVQKSPDGKWIVALTEDGRAAFLPTADLGPYDPSKAPQPAPRTISGASTVVDTATLTIDGQTIHLAGIIGQTGAPATGMQHMIDTRGGTVTCDPTSPADAGTFVCKLEDGVDLARFALFNGAAKPAENASADYQQQAETARTNHRGIWGP